MASQHLKTNISGKLHSSQQKYTKEINFGRIKSKIYVPLCLKIKKEKWRQRWYMAERNLEISSGICPVPCVLCQCTFVFAWKCCLFCLPAYGWCCVCYIYHVEFHFRFRCLVSFPVKYQLWCGCHGERSSKKIR